MSPSLVWFLIISGICAVATPLVASFSHRVPMTRENALPLNFPHEQHVDVACQLCHHNYVDKTGMLACIDCHRGPNEALVLSIEPRFHALCRDCHAERASVLKPHGPVRNCAGCHQTGLGTFRGGEDRTRRSN
jgi:hypothetical protein